MVTWFTVRAFGLVGGVESVAVRGRFNTSGTTNLRNLSSVASSDYSCMGHCIAVSVEIVTVVTNFSGSNPIIASRASVTDRLGSSSVNSGAIRRRLNTGSSSDLVYPSSVTGRAHSSMVAGSTLSVNGVARSASVGSSVPPEIGIAVVTGD